MKEAIAIHCFLICKSKKKCIVPVHAMKAYRGNVGIAPLILNLGSIWRSVVDFTPQPLGKHSFTHLLGDWGAQILCELYRKRKHSLPPLCTELKMTYFAGSCLI